MISEFYSMENEWISISEAIKILQIKDMKGKPFPFDFTYRTFNSQTKKGGKLKKYAGAKYLPEKNPNAIPALVPEFIFSPDKPKRATNHFENRTRNIELATGEIISVRFDFLISINGKKIIY